MDNTVSHLDIVYFESDDKYTLMESFYFFFGSIFKGL